MPASSHGAPRNNAGRSPLETDLYQLTMMAGHFAAGRHERVTATFELFARRLPSQRAFLLVAGLEQVLAYLDALHFADDEIRWLRNLTPFAAVPEAFFDYLSGFAFAGDVWAVAEGTPVFPNEPLIRVTAALAQAQLIETAVLAIVNFQTSIASKAARIVSAAGRRPVMEFGARRAHGLEAALYAARASYLAGCASTSFVEAGRRFGIPLAGTMAHSWVLSARDELSGFERYAQLFGEHSTLLLDTYDTLAAARLIAASGLKPSAVRLDSGDLLTLSRQVREIFDGAGLTGTRILVSGDLDEHRIRAMLDKGAPIDGFGVGTSLVTSEDAPALGGVYKLVESVEDGVVRRVMKTSTGKTTWPGRKQVWRVMADGRAIRDIIALEDEPPPPDAVPLLAPVMIRGARIAPPRPLTAIREDCLARTAELPERLRRIGGVASYPASPSGALRRLIT